MFSSDGFFSRVLLLCCLALPAQAQVPPSEAEPEQKQEPPIDVPYVSLCSALAEGSGAGLGYSDSVAHKVFQTVYDNSDGWSGDLRAFETTAAGIAIDSSWSAQEELLAPDPDPDANKRTIITRDASGGVAFTRNQSLGELTPEQIDQLRAQPLGDMVNSQPVAVGAPNTDYVLSGPDDASYVDFKRDHQGRPSMVYVGANDGMLHGFDVDSDGDGDGDSNGGVEKLAYVPGMLLDKLGELTEPEYEHRYYVDGSPTVQDARINGNWHSVLASGLGFGGRGIFALDATRPDQFAESRADEIALFEYSPALERTLFVEEPAEHLGYIQGKPSLVRLEEEKEAEGEEENGKFALAFGNGYFSPSGKAVLYLVDLDGAADDVIVGDDVKLIVASNTIEDNGLSSVTLVDTDNKVGVDTAYGGDLQGNLWRFDLASGGAKKLFTAQREGKNLPITTGIVVGRHPKGGQMLFFGAGSQPKLLLAHNSQKNLETNLGAYYAIKDKEGFDDSREVIGSSELTKRTLTTGTQRFFESAGPLGEDKKGWYIEFPEGERVVSDALLQGNHILFNTLIPGQLIPGEGSCGAEDEGFEYELSAFDGRPPQTSAFDLNGDGILNEEDAQNGKVAVGMRSQGALFTPVIDTHLEANVENRLNVNTGSRVSTRYGSVNPLRLGRVAWRILEN